MYLAISLLYSTIPKPGPKKGENLTYHTWQKCQANRLTDDGAVLRQVTQKCRQEKQIKQLLKMYLCYWADDSQKVCLHLTVFSLVSNVLNINWANKSTNPLSESGVCLYGEYFQIFSHTKKYMAISKYFNLVKPARVQYRHITMSVQTWNPFWIIVKEMTHTMMFSQCPKLTSVIVSKNSGTCHHIKVKLTNWTIFLPLMKHKWDAKTYNGQVIYFVLLYTDFVPFPDWSCSP